MRKRRYLIGGKDPAEVFGPAWETLRDTHKAAITKWMRLIVAREQLDDVERAIRAMPGLPESVTTKLIKAIEARKQAA